MQRISERVFSLAYLERHNLIFPPRRRLRWHKVVLCESKQKLCEKIPGVQVLKAKLDVWMCECVCIRKAAKQSTIQNATRPNPLSLLFVSARTVLIYLMIWMCFQVQALSIIIKHTRIYAQRKRRERIMKGEAARWVLSRALRRMKCMCFVQAKERWTFVKRRVSW